MSSEDHRNAEVPREEYVHERYSFDELAKGIASGDLTRGQLLKLTGAAVLGTVLGGALPGVAVAKKKKKKKKHHRSLPAPILSPPPPPPSPPPSPPPLGSVSIKDFFFDPADVAIQPGDTVTWTNAGSSPHTVTADDVSFNSGILLPGQSFSQTFQNPGTVTYHCSIHPFMKGSVSVG